MYVQEADDTWPTKMQSYLDRAWLIFIAMVTPISPASSLIYENKNVVVLQIFDMDFRNMS